MSNKILTFLIDTGAEVCLIKDDCLFSNLSIDNQTNFVLTGINGQTVQPKGTHNGYIQLKKNKFPQNFTIVSKDFYLNKHADGILGRDFFNTYSAEINYKDQEVILHQNKQNFHIPFISTPMLEKNINASDQSTTYHEINTTEKINEIIQNITGYDSLSSEEKKSVEKIFTQFTSQFYIEGDVLGYTDIATHKLPFHKQSQPINIRPYRLPESHKTEVNKQVQVMLNNNIITPSVSPWNSPLLVVPKKADNLGNKKWRVVVDFRKATLS